MNYSHARDASYVESIVEPKMAYSKTFKNIQKYSKSKRY